MSPSPLAPDPPELTAEEAEGIRLALEEVDRGEVVALDAVTDELIAEFEALERVRRAG
ncbi:MAG TPA: hypothetical protein VFS00_06020 [Polyangiaceae bacterium]|nr:hypothetical protein [Polyangiaceae bacterium]